MTKTTTLISEKETLEVLKRLGDRIFTTHHFIELYKKLYPDQWKKIIRRYPTGEGERYTARSVAANVLDRKVRDRIVEKLEERIVAEPEWDWGNTWITQWRVIKPARKAVIFRDKDEVEDPDSQTVTEESFQERVAKARKKPNLDELARRAAAPGPVARQQTSTTTFKRRPEVVAWVIENALKHNEGRCELRDCESFITSKGEPYLEVHHVIPLSGNGPDEISNAVALCPACHRELHFGKDKADLQQALYAQIPRLKK